MEALFLAMPIAVAEAVVFYWLHWPHRHLLPERFRTLLLAKGVTKGLTYLLVTAVAAWLSPGLGWAVAIGQPLLGAILHTVWCRSHGIDPIRVQPREQYVSATTAWVQRLEEMERNNRAR